MLAGDEILAVNLPMKRVGSADDQPCSRSVTAERLIRDGPNGAIALRSPWYFVQSIRLGSSRFGSSLSGCAGERRLPRHGPMLTD